VSELRASPCFYESERRRTIAARIVELERELARPGGYEPLERAELEEELDKRRAALAPVSFSEGLDDLRYAWRGLARQVWKAARS
jgi:hypothetical protein